MAEAPDFGNLDATEFRKVLAAGNVTPGEFLRFSPDQQSVVWGNCWDLHSEILKYDYEAPISASAKREDAQRKEERRQEVQRESQKQQEQLQKKKPSLDDLKAIAKASAKKKAMPSLDDLKPSRRNGEVSDSQRSPEEFDIELLLGEWLEKKKQASPKPVPPVEQLWPNLPLELLADLKRRIEIHLKKLGPFMDWESSGIGDGKIDCGLGAKETETILPTLSVASTPPYSAWTLVEKLDDGTSGFGDVWKAQHKRFGYVGVCKFPKQDDRNRNAFESLENEARLVMQLDHPGIVKLKETHLDLPIPFIVFEFSPGKDLAYSLSNLFSEPSDEAEKTSKKQRGEFKRLSPDEAACVMLKIVEIMAAAHSASPTAVLHRDLKPENILVTNYDDLASLKWLGDTPDIRLAEFKILDFGIGGFTTAGRGATTIEKSVARVFDRAGSPNYGSPQRRKGKPPEESDDVYDLGLIWHELLEGEIHLGEPSGQWQTRMQEAGATDDQISVLVGCLEKSRQHRIANAVELARMIREAYPKSVSVPEFPEAYLSFHIHQLSKYNHTLGHPSNKLEALTPRLASWIAKFTGREINLGGLQSLTPDVAQCLAESKGELLNLSGLQSLTAEVAQCLAQFNGESLVLSGLESLTVEVAQCLAQFNGEFLYLSGLETAEVAQCLVKFKGRSLNLSGLQSLTAEVAKCLAEFKGKDLWLGIYTSLTAEVAQCLAEFKGRKLSLEVSGGLTAKVAQCFAEFKCSHLRLTVSGGWTPEVAQCLAEFNGDRLELSYLPSLMPEVAQCLAKFKGSSLHIEVSEKLTPEVEQCLAEFQGHCEVDRSREEISELIRLGKL